MIGADIQDSVGLPSPQASASRGAGVRTARGPKGRAARALMAQHSLRATNTSGPLSAQDSWTRAEHVITGTA